MIRIYGSTFLAATLLLQTGASAQIPPAPTPDVTALFASDTFSNGQSSSVGGALIKYATAYALQGPYYGNPAKVYNPCESSTNPDDWEKCDALRIGAMIGPDDDCDEDIAVLVAPAEDGAFSIKSRLNNIQGESGSTYCDDYEYRPHDLTMFGHAAYHFPDGPTASGANLDAYWERPRLRVMTIGEFPQSADDSSADRVVESLRQACEDYDGAAGILPSIPTWVVFERRPDHEAFHYAGLLAAAGGTGAACYPSTRAACDGTSPCGPGERCGSDGFCVCDPGDAAAPAIDVCEHINEAGRTESRILADLNNGLYGTGSGEGRADVGVMAFGQSNSQNGQSKYIECHVAGNNASACDNNGGEPVPTDLLGILSCVRQLPRGVSAEDATIVHCLDPEDPGSCTVLSEASGNVEWIDTRKTLFLVNGVSCDGVSVLECFPGESCDTGLGGRCADGITRCVDGFEVCDARYGGYPEICNGLDDDCDGAIDNMRDSWQKPAFSALSLPSDHAGLDCNLVDVCSCPDGATDTHEGSSFGAYLDAWDPICQCGEGLGGGPDDPTLPPAVDSDPQASCAAANSATGLPALLMVLIALGLAPLYRRRRG